MKKKVVYTALLGGYEPLRKQEVSPTSNVDFICFTDDPQLVSDDWKIVQIEPRFPTDLVRSQREVKLRVDRYLSEYDASLYIDNSVELLADPEVILESWLADSDYTVIAHSFRERLLEEFEEVVRLNYDDAVRVHEQLWHYAELRPHILTQRPFWNGIIARRHIEPVFCAMETWYEHVLRYSRRDQLSSPFALDGAEFRIRALELDNFDSEYHRWRVSEKRLIHLGKRNVLPDGPAIVDLLRAERRGEELEQLLRDIQIERDGLQQQRDALEDLHSGLVVELETERVQRSGEIVRLEQEIQALRNSTSWRWAAPLRRASAVMSRLGKKPSK